MDIQLTRVAECAEVLPGFSTKGAIEDEPGGTHQVIIARHVTAGEPYIYEDSHKLKMDPGRNVDKRYLLEKGDILFMSRGSGNYAVILDEFPQPAIAPLSFYVLKTKKCVIPEYLVWCLNQKFTLKRLDDIRTGAGTPIVQRRDFMDMLIPVPDLQTQKNIAGLWRLQVREKALLKELAEENDKMNTIIGQRIIDKATGAGRDKYNEDKEK